MEYKGYISKVELDDEAGVFHGEVINLRDVITFQGATVEELRLAFRESVDNYLAFCAERGEEPEKPFSGTFTVRIPPELHRDSALQARLAGRSLNAWVTGLLAAARGAGAIMPEPGGGASRQTGAPAQVGEPRASYAAEGEEGKPGLMAGGRTETPRPLRVYIDTSVFGGCFDPEFSASSRRFFEAIFAGKIKALGSETLVAELIRAPSQVQDLLGQILQERSERLVLTQEALTLRDAYMKIEVVEPKYADDALHVAQATLARADVVVSWNFRHLVNPSRVREFNSINLAQGYGLMVVMTPAELVGVLEAASNEQEEGG